jgi:hypothetical protein
MPFTVVQSAFDGFFPPAQLHNYWKSLYLRQFSDDAIELMVERARTRPRGLSPYEFVYFDIFPMGGAITRVEPGTTAFAERLAPWMVAIDANWTDPAVSGDDIAWVRETSGELGRFGTGETYLNFSGDADGRAAADPDEAGARHLQRLAEVKATYDPDNFFRRNDNVEPAL